MINLLPPEEKEQLLFEKNKKLVIVLGNVAIISLVCLALVLFSLKFYTLGESIYQKVILENAEKKSKDPNFLYLERLLQKYNASLVTIDDFYKKEARVSDALKTISTIQIPQKVHLTDITIKRGADNKINVSLFGVSDTRDTLQVFKDTIESNKKIEHIYFPPDNWIKPTNVNFYLTFETH